MCMEQSHDVAQRRRTEHPMQRATRRLIGQILPVLYSLPLTTPELSRRGLEANHNLRHLD
jgi:hypothetical protein